MAGSVAVPVPRGCGAARKVGGIYLEVDRAPDGVPVEAFLVDPPVPVDPDALGITPKGVKIIDDGEAGVLIDWIGNRDYQNVTDWVEEVRRQGISRRLPSNLEFDQLSADTRLLYVHAKAVIHNSADYWAHGDRWCPRWIPEHEYLAYREGGGLCAAIWWDDVVDGVPVGLTDPRMVNRLMPSFTYLGRCRPDGVQPVYQPGVFFQHRIDRLVVVRDPVGGRHEQVWERVNEADLPVVLVDA